MKAFAFQDVLEPAGENPIRVLARISFLTTENGGLKMPIRPLFRPNHNFGAPDERVFYIGQVEIPQGTQIQPGQTCDLTVTFLNVRGLAEQLQLGRSWRIQAGPTLVAIAQVLSIQGVA